MPIDAELRKKLYNRREWKEAVARVRARGGDRCECRGLCGKLHNLHVPPAVTTYAREVGRAIGGLAGVALLLRADHLAAVPGDGRCLALYSKVSPLTVAHVDHDSGELVPDDKLVLLCPACHLRYDERQHVETRRRKEREELARRGQGRLV